MVGITSGLDVERLIRFQRLYQKCELITGDFTSSKFMKEVLDAYQPDEIYNLAAVSSVAKSFEMPELTNEINYLSVVRILEIIGSDTKFSGTKFYQASSSEIFGPYTGKPMHEYSPINPISPYGEAKALAHMYCQKVRTETDLFIASGILFNHEGEFRQPGFVSSKIIEAAISISQDENHIVHLGNLSAERDWGYAGDYTEAISLMMRQSQGEDFVISTGIRRTVREFLVTAFQTLGIEHRIEKNVKIDFNLFRKNDIEVSVGDSAKAYRELGWKPKVSFEEMIKIMLEARLKETPVLPK